MGCSSHREWRALPERYFRRRSRRSWHLLTQNCRRTCPLDLLCPVARRRYRCWARRVKPTISAACALDRTGLCPHYRRALGRCRPRSIDWGPWGEAGAATRGEGHPTFAVEGLSTHPAGAGIPHPGAPAGTGSGANRSHVGGLASDSPIRFPADPRLRFFPKLSYQECRCRCRTPKPQDRKRTVSACRIQRSEWSSAHETASTY